MEQVLKEKLSQFMSKVSPFSDVLGDHVNWEVKQKREAESAHHPVHRSGVDLKSIIEDADFTVSLQSTEKSEIARRSWEEKQMNEELVGQRQDSKLRKHLCSVEIHSLKVRFSS